MAQSYYQQPAAMQILASERKSYKPFVRLLALIGIGMPIVFQANYIGLTFSARELGNPMQLMQGLAILLAIFFVVVHGLKSNELTRKAMLPVVAFTIMNFFMMLNSFIGHNAHFKYDVVASIKIFYWGLLWLLTIQFVNDSKSIGLIQRCFILGAAGNALIIILFFFGGYTRVDPYLNQGVEASFGAEGASGKAMAGFMIICAVIAPSVNLFKSRWIGSAIGAFILIGVAITNDRSAQVAVSLAIGWMTFWLIRYSSRNSERSVYLRLVLALAVTGTVYISTLSLNNLIGRWADFETENAGSSRLRMWRGAWEYFLESDMGLMLIGGGQENVRLGMIRKLGADIHTHSDLFDQLLHNGLLGVLVYFTFFIVITKIALSINRNSGQYALAIAICGMLFTLSAFTSVLLYTHSMLTALVMITFMVKLAKYSDNEPFGLRRG